MLSAVTTKTREDSQQQQSNSPLTKQERELCKRKRKELELLTKRLNSPAEVKIKVILVGSMAVGKTSLIHKFINDKADIRTTPATILCDFHHCMLRLSGQGVHMRIWDTGGMERFHEKNMASSFYRNSDGVLLVFSVDDFDSFKSLPRWLDLVRENVGPGSQFDCCIVGNKSDVEAERRMVSRREAEAFAYQLGFPYIETSALDFVNVQKAFTDLALAVIKRNQVVQSLQQSWDPGLQKSYSFKLTRWASRGSGGSSGRGCGCS